MKFDAVAVVGNVNLQAQKSWRRKQPWTPTTALSSIKLTSKATRGAASHLIHGNFVESQKTYFIKTRGYIALSRLSWQLVIPTAGQGFYLALKSDH
jgi:hypothetical protein